MSLILDGTNGETFPDGSLQAAAASPYVLKNRIINGAMQVWQRGTSGFTSPSNYSSDRWIVNGGTLSAVGQSTDVPTGFKYSLSVAGSTTPNIIQRIESVNCTDLSGQSITVSFWLKQTVGAGSGAIGIVLYYANSTDSFSSITQIGSTNFITTTGSWAQYTATFTSLPSNVVNGIEFQLYATAGTATFLTTGVQLEIGSTATPFERRLYNQELANCQRYCVVYSGGYSPYLTGQVNSNKIYASVPFAMRTTPSGTYTSINANDTSVSNAISAITFDGSTGNGVAFNVTSTGLTSGRAGVILGTGGTSNLIFSAEL